MLGYVCVVEKYVCCQPDISYHIWNKGKYLKTMVSQKFKLSFVICSNNNESSEEHVENLVAR